MSAAAIIEQARSLGVSIRAEGDTIKAKGPRPAVERILPALRANKPELLAALAKPSEPAVMLAQAERSGHWLIVQSERIERWFSPPVTRAELEARYPGAMLIALPGASGAAGPATAEEAAELRRLVAVVASREGFSDAEQAEALDNALRDPEGALRCFRALLDDEPP